MRSKLFPLLVVAALALLAGSVPAEAQAFKIGVFDAEKISQETAEGARIQARLNALQSAKREEIEALRKELDELQQEFLATSTSLSEEKRKEMGLKIQRKQVELEGLQKSANQELQIEVESAQVQWQRRILEIVADYGKKNGYTLILPVEVVPYYSEAVDITEEIAKVVDEKTSPGPSS
jgi:outer membrane protein